MSQAAPATATKTPAQPSATVKGLAGWVEVFKAGSHTDSKGRPIAFSAGDLDQMVANHALGAAPAVIGHPKDTAPAYAWVDALKREGDSLFAKFADINPAFEAGVARGAYRNRSVSLYQDKANGWRVRHIGWLGAVPPAIDGLAPVQFSGAEHEAREFAAPGYALVWGLESIVRLLRGLRDQLVADQGVEAADAVLPQWQIDSALEAVNTARAQFQQEQQEAAGAGALFQQSDNPGGSMSFTQEQLDAAKAEAAQQATQAAQAQARADFAAKDAELVRLRAERQRERIDAQIGAWKADGRLLPAEEPGLAEFMAQIEDVGAEFSFSQAQGGEVKKTPAQFFADFMAARKALVKLGVRDEGQPAQALDAHDAGKVADAARDFIKAQADKGVVVSVAEAVAHVTKNAAR